MIVVTNDDDGTNSKLNISRPKKRNQAKLFNVHKVWRASVRWVSTGPVLISHAKINYLFLATVLFPKTNQYF